MLQDNLILLFSLIGIALVALLVNYFIARREQQQEYRYKRLRELRKESEEVLTTLSILREANCRKEVVETLTNYAVGLIKEISELAPESDLLGDVSTLKDSADRATPTPSNFTNDRALRRAQVHIQHAEKLIVRLAHMGRVTTARAKQFQFDLYWLHVCVFVDAHIDQGNSYLEQGDKLMAMSHYKHAKAMIARTNVPQKQKQEYIDKIRDLLNKARPSSAMASGNLAASLAELDKKKHN